LLKRRNGWVGVSIVPLLLGVTALASGCGGGGGSAAAAGLPTAKSVTRCVVEGGGAKGSEVPLTPKGLPAHLKLVPLVAQEGDDVIVYLSSRPVLDPEVAHGFHVIHEFPDSRIMLGGHAMMLYLGRHFSQTEQELVIGCVRA
jgi:hypothetical protein